MSRAFCAVLLLAVMALSGAAAGEQAASNDQIQRVTLNATDLNLHEFLRLIAKISGLSVVVTPNVNGTVTAILKDVPWPQALDVVLKSNGLTYIRDGNVIRVLTIEAAHREQSEDAMPTQICTYRLDAARADEVASLLQPFLSPQGRIAADLRSNTLIVRDVPRVLESLGLSPLPAERGICRPLNLRD